MSAQQDMRRSGLPGQHNCCQHLMIRCWTIKTGTCALNDLLEQLLKLLLIQMLLQRVHVDSTDALLLALLQMH